MTHISEHDHHQHEVIDGQHIPQESTPYWRRAHRDWRVWVGLLFMFAAITIYVMTVDLSLVPGNTRPQPVSNTVGR